MEALHPKLVERLTSMMATIEDVAGCTSGNLSHSSAGRIADAVMSVTRAHDEDYARTLELADAFRRLPVQIRVNEAKAPFADGYLTDESVAMLCAAAERDFAARQRDAGWGGDRDPEPDSTRHIVDTSDQELAAMAKILAALDPLSAPAVKRVMRWAWDRYAEPEVPF